MKTEEYGQYQCVCIGSPPPSISWSFEGKQIPQAFDAFNLNIKSYGNRMISSLSLMSRKKLEGKLKCSVDNGST